MLVSKITWQSNRLSLAAEILADRFAAEDPNRPTTEGDHKVRCKEW
jgi:hypothetical protein